MPLWDKVKHELDRAGKVAQEAIDEGRIRLEQVRARQLADKAAQRLGYAYGHARTEGRSVDDDPEITRLRAALTEHEAEATRLEAELAVITRRTPRSDSTADAAAGATGSATSAAADVDAATATDFGGNSGAPHRPDGSMYPGGAAAGGTTESAGGAASTHDAPGAPPSERNEWNREHM
ncbi:MAG: hypothetical protein ACXWZ4_11975 [Gemmatirosa sp.]